jgi:hypothetical protein
MKKHIILPLMLIISVIIGVAIHLYSNETVSSFLSNRLSDTFYEGVNNDRLDNLCPYKTERRSLRVKPLKQYDIDKTMQAAEDTECSLLQNDRNNSHIQFVNDELYMLIKAAYCEIDFYGEFNSIRKEDYNHYIHKFKELIDNETTFLCIMTGEELHLSEFKSIRTDPTSFKEFTFYFFDMNGDSTPELCVVDDANCTYIFMYQPEYDRIILWLELGVWWYNIIGQQKIGWNREGINHLFYQLNEKGDEKCTVTFFSKTYFVHETELGDIYHWGEIFFMVSLPIYDDDRNYALTDDMKNISYLDSLSGRYYFRVTEEQYEILTNDYFEAEKMAEKNIDEVRYRYNELFDMSPAKTKSAPRT